ncbi:Co/Zn/Cd efflux system component [Streptomyces sp. NRRL WC-3618]|uniref:heavy metal transporter n=1 Tax=Streptomyces sp. NRRL WC-3618 TaxID=1519490 RepID=UPI0006C35CD3|nr:heavy metal transporter [Streptomyces sp. NRRL WC-3618]KOV59479.1 Co/Zn/Cd efflux system component [Streptomyces sp. NRRL WC-3618]
MPESSATSTRRGRLLRRVASFVVLLAVAGYLAVQYVTGGTGNPDCEVVSAGGAGATYRFTPEQAVNAATITAVGTTRGLPERAVAIALATSLQESGLRNLPHGDRDSLGLFQQRPSMGWGTEKEIMDPAHSAGEFYDHLVKISDYTRLPLTLAAQRVQRSGYPEAYAKHEPDAVLLAAALTGHAAATLTCEGRPDPTPPGGPDAVRVALLRDFGRDVLAVAGAEVARRTAAAPSPSPTAPTAVALRTVTVPVPPGTGKAHRTAAHRRGWQLAQWAVANASALHIQNVSYAGRRWTAGSTDSQWRPVGTGNGVGEGTDLVRIVTAR